jgi:hypothetical protein
MSFVNPGLLSSRRAFGALLRRDEARFDGGL